MPKYEGYLSELKPPDEPLQVGRIEFSKKDQNFANALVAIADAQDRILSELKEIKELLKVLRKDNIRE